MAQSAVGGHYANPAPMTTAATIEAMNEKARASSAKIMLENRPRT
jgi:hypothetical protein